MEHLADEDADRGLAERGVCFLPGDGCHGSGVVRTERDAAVQHEPQLRLCRPGRFELVAAQGLPGAGDLSVVEQRLDQEPGQVRVVADLQAA